MNKYLKEIIRHTEEHHASWYPLSGLDDLRRRGTGSRLNEGIYQPSMKVLLSKDLGIAINNIEMPLGSWDMYRLRRAIRKWYSNASMEQLQQAIFMEDIS